MLALSTRGKSFERFVIFAGRFQLGSFQQFSFFGELMECLLDIARIIVIERLIAFNRATRTVHFVPFVRGVSGHRVTALIQFTRSIFRYVELD